MIKNILPVLVLLIFLSAVDVSAGVCLKGDCLNGEGVYMWDNGSTFAGSFKHGSPEGEGLYTTPEKMKYIVTYRDGKPIETSAYSEEEEELEKRRKDARKFNQAGLEFYRQKKYQSAIIFFNKAISLWPDNPEFHKNYKKAKEQP